MGTAPLACPGLEQLHHTPGFTVQAVVTQPDRPQGRHLKPQPPAVKQTALKYALPIIQPESLRNPEVVTILHRLEPDVIVVAAYGQILPRKILELAPHGCVNVHASLLPKYRGAAPIQWAILKGESESGITIMQVDAGLDTGPILAQESIPIRDDDTAQSLHDRLAELGAQLLTRTLPQLLQGEIRPTPQNEAESSYARKISRQDGLIHWDSPARNLWNQVRALIPWPGCESGFLHRNQWERLKIWQAALGTPTSKLPGTIVSIDSRGIHVACRDQTLCLTRLQVPGRKKMAAAAFVAGYNIQPGAVLRSLSNQEESPQPPNLPSPGTPPHT